MSAAPVEPILPRCANCGRQTTRYGSGLDPCDCGSGLCDDCCCGWAERCPDCGSTDHEQFDRACPERGSPVRDRAHSAYVAAVATPQKAKAALVDGLVTPSARGGRAEEALQHAADERKGEST